MGPLETGQGDQDDLDRGEDQRQRQQLLDSAAPRPPRQAVVKSHAPAGDQQCRQQAQLAGQVPDCGETELSLYLCIRRRMICNILNLATDAMPKSGVTSIEVSCLCFVNCALEVLMLLYSRQQ